LERVQAVLVELAVRSMGSRVMVVLVALVEEASWQQVEPMVAEVAVMIMAPKPVTAAVVR
jgi:hypothetical protein